MYPGTMATKAAAAAAKYEIDRDYRERLRTLSDGLASTQLQLTRLKSDRKKAEVEATKARCVREFVFVNLQNNTADNISCE